MNKLFSVSLPLPPKQASPNGRFHWSVKARAVRLYRETCGLLIKKATSQRRAVNGTVTIDLDFYTFRDHKQKMDDGFYRPRDVDNGLSSAKAAIDGLRDAGIVKGDSKRYVNIGNVRLHTRKQEHQGRAELVMTVSLTNGEL